MNREDIQGNTENPEKLILNQLHVGIMVTDIEVSKRFYCDVLGFTVDYENTIGGNRDVKLAFLTNGTSAVELVQRPNYQKRSNGPVDHLAFRIKDIDAVKARLVAQGVQFEQEQPNYAAHMFENGQRWIFFAGPDGERFELNERL